MTAPVTLVRADRLYQGVPYAYASVAPPCALVFTAGACPLDENGLIVGAGDVRIQTRQAVANLAKALAAAGAGLTDVLKTTVYVASSDRSDLVAAWDSQIMTRLAPSLALLSSGTPTSSSRSKRLQWQAALALRSKHGW